MKSGSIFEIVAFAIIALIVLFFLFSLHSKESVQYTSSVGGSGKVFGKVEGRDLLVYDFKTNVIYYYFQSSCGYNGYGYFGPYISENGYYCRYINGKIVEIIPVEKNL